MLALRKMKTQICMAKKNHREHTIMVFFKNKVIISQIIKTAEKWSKCKTSTHKQA